MKKQPVHLPFCCLQLFVALVINTLWFSSLAYAQVYTRDNNVWVYTDLFVQRFGFSPEYATAELKGANAAFTGTLHPQVQSAIEYVNQFKIDHEDQGEHYTYSTTGHSKGGGIAQILAHTFGMEGTALDPAPGGAVVENPGYIAFVAELGIDPPGIPEHGFTNYVEHGSLVGDYLENQIGRGVRLCCPIDAHAV